MKKQLFAILLSLCFFTNYAQIRFEEGYFIRNNGEKLNCFIKNIDWKDNPTEFNYRLSEKSAIQTESIKAVSEFRILAGFKYKRFIVDIDRSSEELDLLSTKVEPIFIKEELFLKVLVEGKATLFLYEDRRVIKYFYSKDESNPQQLVFKSYLVPPVAIRENNAFRLQLNDSLACDKLSYSDIERLGYNDADLIHFFVLYNECAHTPFVNYEKRIKRNSFGVSIRPGIIIPNFSIRESSSGGNISRKFSSKPGFRIGLEAEYVFPFNKNKWAVFAEPAFQYIKTEAPSGTTDPVLEANYKAFELSTGLKHTFYLHSNSVVFLNALWQMAFPIKSTIGKFRYDGNLDISYSDNMAFGAGFKYKRKYAIEFRYATKRDLLGKNPYWRTNYQAFSIIVGYNLF